MRVIALALLLVGCSGNAETDSVDVNAAAVRAQADIDRYAAGTPRSAGPTHTAPPIASSPAANETPFVEASTSPTPRPGTTPADARALVIDYYALIDAGRYRQARLLWGQGGDAAPLDAKAFAASFRRFTRYRARVGEPFDGDAGAGSIFVSVPARISGTLRDGGTPYRLGETVMLKRLNDGIDGATPQQKRWNIMRIEPAREPPGPAPTPS